MMPLKPQHFFFSDDRLFFNISSFPAILGVKQTNAVDAAIHIVSDYHDHVLKIGCSIPSYIDGVAFDAVCDFLKDNGIAYDIDNKQEVRQMLFKDFPVLNEVAAKSSLDSLLSAD